MSIGYPTRIPRESRPDSGPGARDRFHVLSLMHCSDVEVYFLSQAPTGLSHLLVNADMRPICSD